MVLTFTGIIRFGSSVATIGMVEFVDCCCEPPTPPPLIPDDDATGPAPDCALPITFDFCKLLPSPPLSVDTDFPNSCLKPPFIAAELLAAADVVGPPTPFTTLDCSCVMPGFTSLGALELVPLLVALLLLFC